MDAKLCHFYHAPPSEFAAMSSGRLMAFVDYREAYLQAEMEANSKRG